MRGRIQFLIAGMDLVLNSRTDSVLDAGTDSAVLNAGTDLVLDAGTDSAVLNAGTD